MAVQVERMWEFMTKGLAFGGFSLCSTKGSNYYILLAIFIPFLWTIYKVWPLNLDSHKLSVKRP